MKGFISEKRIKHRFSFYHFSQFFISPSQKSALLFVTPSSSFFLLGGQLLPLAVMSFIHSRQSHGLVGAELGVLQRVAGDHGLHLLGDRRERDGAGLVDGLFADELVEVLLGVVRQELRGALFGALGALLVGVLHLRAGAGEEDERLDVRLESLDVLLEGVLVSVLSRKLVGEGWGTSCGRRRFRWTARRLCSGRGWRGSAR